MPLALDPNETHRYVICTDRAKTLDREPTLIFHFPTAREQRTIARLFEESDLAANVDQSIELRCKAVRTILIGWENFFDRAGQPIPYDPANLDSVLSDNDMTELNARLLREMSLTEMDKKKFALSALSSSANFAANAKGRASSHPAKSSPPSSNALPVGETTRTAQAAEGQESSD